MIKKGILLIGLLTAWNVQAQDVNHYTPGTMEEGVVYYLPKTQIEIQVTATKVAYTPGELCQYANRYLRLQGISAQPSEHWEINDIKVNTIGVPDAQKAYSIKVKDKMVTSQVELTEDGIIKAINTAAPEEKKTPRKKIDEKSKRVDPRSFMTEEMLMAGSTNKMAELIAKEIYNIRESKNSLTRGQADYMPQDGAALQIMLTNLEKQEKAMTELFTGKTVHTDQVLTFHIEPEKEIQDQVLFRFSQKLGILESDNLAGEPIYITITDESNLPSENEEVKVYIHQLVKEDELSLYGFKMKEEKDNVNKELVYTGKNNLTNCLIKYCYQSNFDYVIILMQDILTHICKLFVTNGKLKVQLYFLATL